MRVRFDEARLETAVEREILVPAAGSLGLLRSRRVTLLTMAEAPFSRAVGGPAEVPLVDGPAETVAPRQPVTTVLRGGLGQLGDTYFDYELADQDAGMSGRCAA
jgi:hypothetical protein